MLRTVALWLGLVLGIIGLLGIGAYLWGVVDIMINQPPDQSWLFWASPLAMIGTTLLIGGIGLLILWRHLKRRTPEDRN